MVIIKDSSGALEPTGTGIEHRHGVGMAMPGIRPDAKPMRYPYLAFCNLVSDIV